MAVPEETSKIHVCGTGTTKATPDRFCITFGVKFEHPDLDIVYAKVSRDTASLLTVLKAWAGKHDSVKTSSYRIHHYEYDVKGGKWNKGDVIATVSTSVSIESSRTDAVAELITLALKSGSTTVDSLQFYLSDERKRNERKTAIIRAFDAAREDALTLAETMSVTLRGPASIQVEKEYNYRSQYDECDDTILRSLSSETTPEFIQPGDAITSVTVNVVYTY